MITAELRGRAEELMRTECVHQAAWRELVQELLKETQLEHVIAEIAVERARQVSQEGYDDAHDDEHTEASMAVAAACYSLHSASQADNNDFWLNTYAESARKLWPWDHEWWKPQSWRRDLVRAAALIVAEYQRRERAEARQRG